MDDNSSPYVPTHLVVSTMQGSDYINFKMIDSNNKLVPSRCTSLYDKPGSASRQSTSKKYLLFIFRLTFFLRKISFYNQRPGCVNEKHESFLKSYLMKNTYHLKFYTQPHQFLGLCLCFVLYVLDGVALFPLFSSPQEPLGKFQPNLAQSILA